MDVEDVMTRATIEAEATATAQGLRSALDAVDRALAESANLPPAPTPALPDLGDVPGVSVLRLRAERRQQAIQARQELDAELMTLGAEHLPQAHRAADSARADLNRARQALAAPAAAEQATAAAAAAVVDAEASLAKAAQVVVARFKAAGGDPSKGVGPLHQKLKEAAAKYYNLREQVAAAELAQLDCQRAETEVAAARQAAERARAAERDAAELADRARREMVDAQARLDEQSRTINELDGRVTELRAALADPALSASEYGF